MNKALLVNIKSVLFFVIFFCGSFLFSFSARVKIYGLIKIYGNEPNTSIGFVTDTGKEYSLIINEDSEVTKNQILKLQGVHLELNGKYIKDTQNNFNTLKDGEFFVYTMGEIK